MKALGWALTASMAMHALLLLFYPFQSTVAPQLPGRNGAVIVTLSASHPTHQSRAKPAHQTEPLPLPSGADRKRVHENTAPGKPEMPPELPPAAQRPNRSSPPLEDRGNATPKTVSRVKPATRDDLGKAEASMRTAAASAEPTPSVARTSADVAKPCADTRHPPIKTRAGADSRADPTETAAAGNRSEGTDAADATGTAVIRAVPLYRQNAPPSYPRHARQRGYEGQVVIDVLVGERGEVVALIISRSSGYALLDRASLEAVRNWCFEPAHLGSRPIAMWVKVPVRFKLE